MTKVLGKYEVRQSPDHTSQWTPGHPSADADQIAFTREVREAREIRLHWGDVWWMHGGIRVESTEVCSMTDPWSWLTAAISGSLRVQA